MKKLKVIRELPFGKVGDEFDVMDNGSIVVTYGKIGTPICRIWVYKMTKEGWLSDVNGDRRITERRK